MSSTKYFSKIFPAVPTSKYIKMVKKDKPWTLCTSNRLEEHRHLPSPDVNLTNQTDPCMRTPCDISSSDQRRRRTTQSLPYKREKHQKQTLTDETNPTPDPTVNGTNKSTTTPQQSTDGPMKQKGHQIEKASDINETPKCRAHSKTVITFKVYKLEL
jgi:hypothetical protein